MNKYLIVATDNRSYLDLKNIVLELKSRNLPYFFLYSTTNNRISPQTHLHEFLYDTNSEFTEEVYSSKTLGFQLPFKPNILLITNENWEPEKSILWEFKQWGCFIGCIENSSWLHNNIKTKLELASRKTFPSNCIDVFFDHSKWCLETKTKAGWWGQKSIIVGNPHFDNLNLTPIAEQNIMIVYGSMEDELHPKILNLYYDLCKKYPKWEIFYKPHPNEMGEFPEDFKENINVLKQEDFLDVLNKSTHNIGMFTSVMFYPLLLNKNVVILGHSLVGGDEELDIESFNSYKFEFWKRILGFKDFKNFKEFISEKYIKDTIERNQSLETTLKKHLVFYDKEHTFMQNRSNNKAILNYYIEYIDNKASHRIINYIENE